MAMIMVDSFGHYTQPFMNKKWDVVSDPNSPIPSGASITQSPTGGRFGGGGVTFTNSTSGSSGNGTQIYIQKNYDGVTTIICGLAVKQTNTQRDPRGGRLLTFVSGNTAQVMINILESGQLRALHGVIDKGIMTIPFAVTVTPAEEVILGVSTNAISSSSFDFLEFKIVHHPNTGSITVRRNGSLFWELTNVNTDPAGTGNSSSVCVGGYISEPGEVSQALQAVISDFHLLNTTAGGTGDPVDFIGDRHWEPLFPMADATYTEWTPDPVGDHYLNINTVPPNEARNNSTDIVGTRDTFEFEQAAGPGNASMIFAYTMYVQKDSGGSIGISGLSRSPAGGGGTDGNGTEVDVPSPYAFRQSFGFIDPDTATAWTVDGFNAAEHGYERSS